MSEMKQKNQYKMFVMNSCGYDFYTSNPQIIAEKVLREKHSNYGTLILFSIVFYGAAFLFLMLNRRLKYISNAFWMLFLGCALVGTFLMIVGVIHGVIYTKNDYIEHFEKTDEFKTQLEAIKKKQKEKHLKYLKAKAKALLEGWKTLNSTNLNDTQKMRILVKCLDRDNLPEYARSEFEYLRPVVY